MSTEDGEILEDGEIADEDEETTCNNNANNVDNNNESPDSASDNGEVNNGVAGSSKNVNPWYILVFEFDAKSSLCLFYSGELAS